MDRKLDFLEKGGGTMCERVGMAGYVIKSHYFPSSLLGKGLYIKGYLSARPLATLCLLSQLGGAEPLHPIEHNLP